MTARDHLRRSVLDVLWSADGLTAAEVVERLPGRELALTTVLTVLERLRKDGLVERERDGRSYRHRPAVSREDYTARVMMEALGGAGDRDLVLARFVDHVSAADADALRSALSTGCGCGPGCGCRPGPGGPGGGPNDGAAEAPDPHPPVAGERRGPGSAGPRGLHVVQRAS